MHVLQGKQELCHLRTIEHFVKSGLYFAVMKHYFRLRALISYLPSDGQGLVEYAFIILLVGLSVIVLLSLFGRSVGNLFSNIIANF